MVSNLDTDTINQTVQTMQGKVENQSEDEILDYLMGSKSTSVPKELKTIKVSSFKQNIKQNYSKLRQDVTPKSEVNSFVEVASEASKKLSKTLIALFDKSSLVYNKVNELVCSIDLAPALLLVNRLHSVRLIHVDLTPDQAEFLKAKTKPLRVFLEPLSKRLIHLFDQSVSFIIERLSVIADKVPFRMPALRHGVAGLLLLIGCGVMAVVSQVAMNNGTQPDEDLLSSRKLAPVNWNVNGQVTDAEKANIKSLFATAQLKVLPKGKTVKTNIQLVTDTTSIQDKSVSPDTSFMMISSNTIPHSVSNGESVLSISQKYKVSISDLISSNPDADLINLKAGDSIVIPNALESNMDASLRPSRIYSKIPRNLLASRSMSGLSRANNFNVAGSGSMLWPVPSSNTISSQYGPRWGGFHPGVDITAPIGTPIVATKDGVVISSGWEGGYGNCVIVDHGNGIATRYAHASSLSVKTGQPVKAGQLIARMGSTGWSTGSHLHYEVMVNSRHTNPMRYF